MPFPNDEHEEFLTEIAEIFAEYVQGMSLENKCILAGVVAAALAMTVATQTDTVPLREV